MEVAFEKWHGCRNDFILIEVPQHNMTTVGKSLQRLAAGLCRRDGSGIGADGIIVLAMAPSDRFVPAELEVINSDGSVAANCGNGLRCVTGYVSTKMAREGKTPPDLLELSLGSRMHRCRFMGGPSDGPITGVELGVPSWDGASDVAGRVRKHLVDWGIDGLFSDVRVCHVGNGHLLLFSDETEAFEHFTRLGETFAEAEQLNVHIVCSVSASSNAVDRHAEKLGAISEYYRMQSWERGAGPTPACGSGAGAATAAILQEGLTSRRDWLVLDSAGGRLYGRQQEGDEEVLIVGPTQRVFFGKVTV